MTGDPWDQVGYGVRCEWGPVGASRLGPGSSVLVVVDVLSFTTSVTIAVERGTVVYPAAWRDERAVQLAREEDAVLAVGRRETTEERRWSLSPSALAVAPAPARLVLPSPNGSAIAAAASDGTVVVAGCLRNAAALGAWLRAWCGTQHRPVTVIPAGERWPDGSLRPALEDLLGAGAVIAALARSDEMVLSPEAAAARALYLGTGSVLDAVRDCASGAELIAGGFGQDVELAAQCDVSQIVPGAGRSGVPASDCGRSGHVMSTRGLRRRCGSPG